MSHLIRVARLLVALTAVTAAAKGAPGVRPNVIVFLCDNLGYGDVGAFGNTVHRTPNIDRFAREGMKFTHAYAASAVCTPSRAALMTGCYPVRLNLHRNARGGAVLQPIEPIGLHPAERTMAEMFKGRGYATMMIGKWHLGDQLPFLPTRQGFDRYIGVPYSDDMTPREGQRWPPLPLMRDEVVIEAPVDRDTLTVRETADAIAFITERRERPFFLYVAHAMPGSTTTPFSSPAFRGKSRNGSWGDAVEELDWSLGEVLTALRRHGLDDRTLVVWTSDNGAPTRSPPQGNNGPLGGAGYTVGEAGMRVPLLVRWPGQIPAGTVSTELVTLMDLLPTFARLVGDADLKAGPIDGRDIWALIAGAAGARSPHEGFLYYMQDQLQAVRSGAWKLYLPLERIRARSGKVDAGRPRARLYDVVSDPGETRDVAASHPEIVARLQQHAERARVELGDLDRAGRGQRPAGWVGDPQPRVLGR